ncbi:MAG: phosphoesterase [Deferribacteraceae bacterium]|jgi:oligoribonuclease NrnB/cAMP/cGMP phosphodiesterase (DHH superfamily)|nr:phosphoesterase [Deferribacteraceae bacterium]
MLLHISHNDLDGVCCGILIKSVFPKVKTLYLSYEELPTALNDIPSNFSSVIITDISPPLTVVETFSGDRDFLLIDHHISTAPLATHPFVKLDINKCAALLTYEKLTADGHDLTRYEKLVERVNDFDLWKLKFEDSLKLNILFNLLGIERFEKRFLETPYTEFLTDEDLIISIEEVRRDAYIRKAMKNAHRVTDRNGCQVAAVFAEAYSSELGNALIKQGDTDYAVIINAQRGKFSLRSRADIDVSKLAEERGGGGHKNAAGFSDDPGPLIAWVLEKIRITP